MASGGGILYQYELEGVKENRSDGRRSRIGSRGIVFEVKLKARVYIAKKPHTIFVKESSPEESSEVSSKFRKECILLSQLSHPNIVKFIGVYYKDVMKTDLILVMEKLKCDLDEFMFNNSKPELSLQLTILQDVSRGLYYLHGRNPPVVHRDLTARNVCLTGTNRAKIIDFNMAKVMDSRAILESSHKKLPHQMYHLPPETKIEKPEFTPKLDIFSFGHLTLHVIIWRVPRVNDKTPDKVYEKGIVEQQKRQQSLDEMGSSHCLYDVTLDCLRDDPNERPNAPNLLDYLMEKTKKKTDDEKFTEAYKHFIDSKDVLELLSLKFMFIGPPRQGKSTTRRRVMKEIIDLISAGEEKKIHGSTGAVECCSNMLVKNRSGIASTTGADWSVVENLSDEACLLFHNLKDALESIVTSENIHTISTKQSIVRKETPQSELELHNRHLVSKHSVHSSATTPPQPSLAYQPPSHDQFKPHLYSEIAAIYKRVSEQPNFVDSVKHIFKAYLRMEDTGGQPELMDMLPALTIGPGLYLLFFSYEFQLDEEYQVFFQRDTGEKTAPEKSTFTLQEMLLCILSSISCSTASNNFQQLAKSNNADMNEILESSKSVAYIVGTHKDKVSEEYIAEVDDQFQKIIEDTDFFKKDIVQFCSEEKLVVSLDNMGGGIEEIHRLHQLLERAMKKHFKKLKIPAVWLLFSLCLRMRDVRTASMETCLELSRTLNITNEETKVALWFLHHHAGVLMYFPSVPGLEDFVIIDVQVVYDSITSIILEAMSFDYVGKAKSTRFKKTGQFTLKDLAAATTSTSKDLIPPHKLVALLSYLHIIAEVPLNTAELVTKEREYIMPCVLESTTSKELDMFHKEACRSYLVFPLLIHFTCGFTPMGLFPATIACLISNKFFTFIREGVKKNMVQFLFQSELRVIFMSRPKFYEVVVSCQPTFQASVHAKCVALKRAIESTLKEASSRMNYSSYMDYQFGFECSLHEGQGHFGVISGENSLPKTMTCFYNIDNPQLVVLQNKHLIWYGQEYQCSEVSDSSTSGSPLSVFLSVYPDLINSVKPCVLTVADHCYSRRLISEHIYDHIIQRSDWTDRDKARYLLSNVRSALSVTPQALEDLVSVLFKVDDCKIMAEKIQKQLQ